MRVLLDLGQGRIEGWVGPRPDFGHDGAHPLIEFNDELMAWMLCNAPHRAAEQVRQGPGGPVIRCARHGHIHAGLLMSRLRPVSAPSCPTQGNHSSLASKL